MTDDSLNELGRKIRALVNALPTNEELKAGRMLVPKPEAQPYVETLDKLLRQMDDRAIDTKLMAQLLNRDPETIYRRVKAGILPCTYEGRNLRFFAPQVAAVLLKFSETRKRALQDRRSSKVKHSDSPISEPRRKK